MPADPLSPCPLGVLRSGAPCTRPSAPFLAFLFLVTACGSEEGEGQGVRAGREAPAVAARVRSQDPWAVDLRSLLDLGAAPRSFKEGNSLEEFFLQVTGKESDGAE